MKRLAILPLVLVWLGSASGDEPAGVKQTIAFLQKLQTNTGGFLSMAPQPNIRLAPNLRATSSAIRALKHLGGDVPNKDAAAKFVAGCFDETSGGFSEFPKGKPDVFTTALGIMAVEELKLDDSKNGKYMGPAFGFLSKNAKSFEEIRIAAAAYEGRAKVTDRTWEETVRKLQNDDGVFGKGPGLARATGGSVVTLIRLGGKVENTDKILAVIKEGQRLNGGWGKEEEEIGSDLETTYRVMRCFHMLKSQPKSVEGVRSFIAKCRNEDGGYAVAPGENSTISGTYFAAIILHWLK